MDISELLRKVKRVVSSNSLLFGTLAGACAGFLLGLILKQYRNATVTTLAGYPGEMYMRGLQMLIIPVVLFSLMAGSASLDMRTNGKIALRTFLYFLGTSLGNAVFGITLAIIFQPGDTSVKLELKDVQLAHIEERKNTLLDNFLDLGRNIVPNNIFSSFFEMTTTIYTKQPGQDGDIFVKSIGSRRGTNALGLIFFALMFGTFMSLLQDAAKPFRDVVVSIDAVTMKAVSALIWLTPFGVASLICAKVLEVDDMGKILSSLFYFITTVAIGIVLYQLIFLQLIYFLLLRKNPFSFYTKVLPAALTGFAADSSSAALPVSLRCLDELGIDSRISHFVVPIGVICNMDGTAMFISMASIFIAQMNGVALGTGDYITICFTATAVSIAAASAPSASLTLLPIVLNAIGAPIQDIGLLFAIDWLNDRMRTTNNVLGDCYASAIIEDWSRKELEKENMGDIEKCEVGKIEMTDILNQVDEKTIA